MNSDQKKTTGLIISGMFVLFILGTIILIMDNDGRNAGTPKYGGAMKIEYEDQPDEYGFRAGRIFVRGESTAIAEIYGRNDAELLKHLIILGLRRSTPWIHYPKDHFKEAALVKNRKRKRR